MTVKHLGFTCASLMPLAPSVWNTSAQKGAELGFDSLWTAETTGPEAFSMLSGVAPHMPGASLGTGVLALQLRTPMLAAMGAATLAATHGRTVRLGVGISSPVVVNRWHGETYGPSPMAQTREYLELVKRCLHDDVVTFEGDYYSTNKFRLGVQLPEEKPKIVLGALNPKMLSLAGEVADGVLLNYLPPNAVEWCIRQVHAGEDTAGRPRGSCEIITYVHAGVTNHAEAITKAKKDLFSYIVVPAYARAFSRAGFTDSVNAVLEAHGERRRDDAIAAVSDEMVDQINTIGTSERITESVRSYAEAGVDHIVIMPMPWGDDRQKVIDDTLTAARAAIPN